MSYGSELVTGMYSTPTLTSYSFVSSGIVIAMDERSLFDNNGAGGAFFLINFMYGFGALLMAYVFSFATKSAPSSYALYILVALVTGKERRQNIITILDFKKNIITILTSTLQALFFPMRCGS